MKKIIEVLEYLQNNDKNGNYMDILDEIEEGALSITGAKLECITILQRFYGECIASDNYLLGNKIAGLAMELQRSL